MTDTLPLATETCCTPLRAAVDATEAQRLARIFKALGDPTRVMLLSTVATSPDGEACVCDLTAPVGLSQPTVSHHLKILVDAGLLTRSQRGRWSYYALLPGAIDHLTGDLRALV
ncbi:metalloregulator ArsR/SmtB family transcription factor [Isoptericola halotolerans]|uniref:ArsR family transcriptional regulator n=1 Tax=Isoptericola halotolerans TaxID=300560 RepID=A0ABX1ZYI3_9MICO|nr:metalloregulator ArsR/SmtB family transcription factor [Isoptericola halotolerans]NOV95667.1 ArsR family transcriptional regulator [Isoptericola halotolerans]